MAPTSDAPSDLITDIGVLLALTAFVLGYISWAVEVCRAGVRTRRWRRHGFSPADLAPCPASVAWAVRTARTRGDAIRVARSLALGWPRTRRRRLTTACTSVLAMIGITLAVTARLVEPNWTSLLVAAFTSTVAGLALGTWVGIGLWSLYEYLNDRVDPLQAVGVAVGAAVSASPSETSRYWRRKGRADTVAVFEQRLRRAGIPTDDLVLRGDAALDDDVAWAAFLEVAVLRAADAYDGEFITIQSATQARGRRHSGWARVRQAVSLASIATFVGIAHEIWALANS
jgi:hypothetical protein